MSPSVDFISSSNRPFVPVSIPRDAGDLRDTPSPSPLSPTSEVYYNARLDPKNFLDGPLSLNAATRLRQMLARPGIVVSRWVGLGEGCMLNNHQVAPGICDGISARCALEAGFNCLYQRFVTT
jgi:hypothetical protein